MDFINDKLTSLTAPAISRVNEMSKRRSEKELERKRKNSSNKGQQETIKNISNSMTSTQLAITSTSLSRGIPFGADTFSYEDRLRAPPPPIGFRTDLLQQEAKIKVDTTAISIENDNQENQQQQLQQPSQPEKLHSANSDSNLYDGDTWSRVWFQRVMLLSLIRLLLFIRKVYEDFHATKTYNNLPGYFGHFMIALATLFLPTIVFTIYRVSRYLQIVLPQRRALTEGACKNNSNADELSLALPATSSIGLNKIKTQPINNEEDGLVTARQSPINNMEVFHDSTSQQDLAQTISGSNTNNNDNNKRQTYSTSPAPSTALVGDSPPASKSKTNRKLEEANLKETVEIDKLGNLPDKESVRIIIGASEQLLHGVLYIFWQLKRQVDVMGYLVERACLWRKPSDNEKEELSRLRTGSDGLEWFQDFYAAFLAILVQVYSLGQHWTLSDNGNNKLNKQQINNLFSASGSPLGNIATIESPELSVSNAAKVLSDTIRQQQTFLTNSSLDGKDLLIMSELIVSSAVVLSLLIAVRRKDDGPLTLALSMLGWGSIFASRIIMIALSFVHLGWRIMLPLCFCHILGITIWIYKISIDSHNDKESEQGDENRWATSDLVEEANVSQPEQAIQLTTSNNNNEQQATIAQPLNTSRWTVMEHFTLILQIFTLFSIPSLFYWPIMFNLKTHYRPFKYLVLILSENFLLVLIIWTISAQTTTTTTIGQYYLIGAVCSFSIVGFIFVSLYIACKPTLTEYFARADELFNEAEKSGIYFEFCSRVFKMPDLSKQTFRRLMNQTEEQIEEEINLDD